MYADPLGPAFRLEEVTRLVHEAGPFARDLKRHPGRGILVMGGGPAAAPRAPRLSRPLSRAPTADCLPPASHKA